MRPIPISALSDTITVNNLTYSNVLVENHRRFMPSTYGASEQSNYLLIVDAVNTPDYQILKSLLKIGVSVGYNGKFHTVKELEILTDRLTGSEHHMELVLL